MFNRQNSKKSLKARIEELEKELADKEEEQKTLVSANNLLKEKNALLESDLEAAIGMHGRDAVDCNNILRLQHSRIESAYAVLRIAHSQEHTMDDVLESILQFSRRIGDHTVRALLYEVHPVNRVARKIINEEIENGQNPLSDKILLLKSDSSKTEIDPEYFTIKKGTVLGDSYFNKRAVVCTDDSQVVSNFLGKVICGSYNVGRAGIDSRASFPIINPKTNEIASFVVIEQDKPLKDYEILYVQSFVHLASLALAIKQDYDSDTKLRKMIKVGAHNLKSSLSILNETVGIISESIQAGRYDNIPKYASTLKRTTDTIAEVLNYIQDGKIAYKFSSLSPESMIQDTVEDSKGVYKNIEFEYDFGADDRMMPIAKEPFVMALQNIIKNLSEQAESKDMQAKMTIGTGIADDHYRITVRDNAGGMPPEIYETFEKGGKISTKPDGTATGVISVLDTFRKMGFDIEMSNNPGVGLTYYIQKKI